MRDHRPCRRAHFADSTTLIVANHSAVRRADGLRPAVGESRDLRLPLAPAGLATTLTAELLAGGLAPGLAAALTTELAGGLAPGLAAVLTAELAAVRRCGLAPGLAAVLTAELAAVRRCGLAPGLAAALTAELAAV
jgi:hypothetical protein